ncbi:hypothetical protein ACP4OV_022024 [Aristida adscensionis]
MAALGATRREEEAGGIAEHRGTMALGRDLLLGVAAASTAMALAAVTDPPLGMIDRTSYLLALSGVFFAGVNQVAVAVWAGPDPSGRRIAAGRKLVRASLLAPLTIAAGMKLASLLQ